jgi:hypothetical protein
MESLEKVELKAKRELSEFMGHDGTTMLSGVTI